MFDNLQLHLDDLKDKKEITPTDLKNWFPHMFRYTFRSKRDYHMCDLVAKWMAN